MNAGMIMETGLMKKRTLWKTVIGLAAWLALGVGPAAALTISYPQNTSFTDYVTLTPSATNQAVLMASGTTDQFDQLSVSFLSVPGLSLTASSSNGFLIATFNDIPNAAFTLYAGTPYLVKLSGHSKAVVPGGTTILNLLSRNVVVARTSITTAPSVTLTTPVAGMVVAAPATIALGATATSSSGSISKVDFYQGTNSGATRIGTATNAPFTATWSAVPAGSYTLTAVATTSAGIASASAPVSITVTASGAKLYFLHTDQLGTPRLVTDETKKVVWRNSPLTEPFGIAPVEEDPDGDGKTFTMNLRFPGQYADKETNTNYNYYRDFDPSTGRYLESDPIGLRGGINTFAYVGGNPLKYIDIFGLDVWMCRRDSDFPFPLNNIPHYWLKTDSQEGGMGGGDGKVPGNTGASGYPLMPVQTVNHAGQSTKANAECKLVPDVNEQCVNTRIKPNQPIGRFHGGNSCMTFVMDVIDDCRTVPPPECAANPECAKNWQKYRRPGD